MQRNGFVVSTELLIPLNQAPQISTSTIPLNFTMRTWRNRLRHGEDGFHVDDPTAIEILHPKKEPTAKVEADIVLVAGLGGHFIKTWQGEDNTVWPSDLLPSQVPDIRVLSFQYNTSLNGTMSMLGIEEHANDLLTWLYNNREDDQPAILRPLIFVGHSLGGMIIKRALFKARFGKQMFRGLWHASRGVMFFATPHLGLDRSTWKDFARFVLQHDAPVRGAIPTDAMVEQLEANCDTLLEVTEDFKPLYESLAFVTFIEEEPMPGLRKVLVNGVYGKMHDRHERHNMLLGNHITICQFTREQIEAFRLVQDGVEFLKGDKPNALDEAGYSAKRALHSLSTDKFHAYFLERPQTPGTGSWIKERREFQEWHQGKPGRCKLWIHGPAGSGKSFLTKHIITHIIRPDNIIQPDDKVPSEFRQEVIHCFLSNMYASRDSIQALLQSTLHQALRLQPQLIQEFLLPNFEDAQSRERSEGSVWTVEKLVDLWPRAMAKVIMEHQNPVTLVIDGLDEIHPHEQQTFFQCIERLEDLSQSKTFRLLVVSQPNPMIKRHIQSLGFNDYSIQPEDNEADITSSISGHLTRLLNTISPGDEELRTLVLEDIKGNMADDLYLRSVLKSEELKRTRVKDKSDIFRALKDIPDDTQTLCHRLVDRMLNSHDRETCQFIKYVLIWAAYQEDALNITELNTALALTKAMDKFPGSVITEKQLADCLDENLKAKVDFYCGQLVNLSEGRLSPLHRSVKSNIATHLETIAEKNPDQRTPQGLLASACSMYLSMKEAEPPAGESSEVTWESRIRKTVKGRPLMRYASLYWHKHLHQAGDDVDPDTQKRKELLTKEGDDRAKLWTEVWWFMARGSEEPFPEEDLCLADRIVNSAADSRGGGSSQSSGSSTLRSRSARRRDHTPASTVPQEYGIAEHLSKPGVEGDRLSTSPTVRPIKEIVEVEKKVVEVEEKVVEVEKKVVQVVEVEKEVIKKVPIVQIVEKKVFGEPMKPEVYQIDRVQYITAPKKKRKPLGYLRNIGRAVSGVAKAVRGKEFEDD